MKETFSRFVELDWFEKHARGRSYEWAKPPGDGEEPPKTTDGKP
jgi:hypothetical protein